MSSNYQPKRKALAKVRVVSTQTKEDMPVVRHTIRKYKKSTNRKPKLWYEKKVKHIKTGKWK